jgi:photosystem II stability/assembly factor-like uncharacterized protein
MNGWQPRIATLSLSLVTALAYREGLLLAGGLEGIAYSLDEGMHWQQAALEDGAASVTAFALSPRFAEDHTAVASTMENGILRTDDGGRTWVNVSFGLESFEVSTVAWFSWFSGSIVLAATSDGIYRSSNGGRAWRRVYEAEESGIDTIVPLSERDFLAPLENGGLLRSTDGGAHWILDEKSLQGMQILSLFVEGGNVATGHDIPVSYNSRGGKTLFAGTVEQGLLRSLDGGGSWETVYNDTVHTLTSGNGMLYAGTGSGVSYSADGGRTWHNLPSPPIHDLNKLLVYKKQPLLVGAYTGVVYYTGAEWRSLPDLPQALTATAIAPDGSLYISSVDGLMRLSVDENSGESGVNEHDTTGPYEQRILLDGRDGQVNVITFRKNGASWQTWAASADGKRLLRSDDEGRSWQFLHPPFGILPVVALEAMPQRIVAATFDPRQYRICIWSSVDDGKTWERGMEAETQWPIVATSDDPPLITISTVIFLQNASEQWNRVSMSEEGGMIRRVISIRQTNTASTPTLVALTTTGIYRSDDWGESWQPDNEGLPVEQIVAIAGDNANLYVLLAGGQVMKRPS